MRTEVADDSARAHDLRFPVVLFMAVAAALGTTAIYPLQPAIADVAVSLGSSTAAVGVALACGPAGYLVGLGLLVPLVDRFPPRFVLAAQFIALGGSIGATAAVPNSWLLGVCVLLSGLCSSVGAGLSSVAGRLSSAGRRATVLGTVTAGISAGILIGRIVGGWLADMVGWRGMLLVFAAACLAIAGAAMLLLPRVKGGAQSGYLATLRSIPSLFVRFASLRLAATRGAAWFFAFCAIWAGSAVALSGPPFNYSAERIGLFALAGLTGIVATRVSGVLTDRLGSRTVILVGLALAGVAAAALGFVLGSPGPMIVCLALFDAGLFAAQVANQATVLAIDPQAPARFNSAYMIVYFVGGSLGTAFGAAAVSWIGWSGTATGSVAAIGLGAAITLSKDRDMRPPEHLALDSEILLRRLRAEDAEAAHRAVLESFATLHPWMPWAAEEPKPGDQEAFVATSISDWDAGRSYIYGIFDPRNGVLLGTVGLHARVGPGAFDIGYWLAAEHTGKGAATRAARALSEVAFRLPGTERVEIHCDEANTASAAIPKRLGFRLDRIEEHSRDAPAETGRRMIWVKNRI